MKLTCFSLEMVFIVCACGFVLHMNKGPFASATALKFCGSFLVDTMSIVCQGNYRKRYDPDSYELTNSLLPYEAPDYLSRASPISILVKRASVLRRSRGIIDECCLKSCTFDTLRSYCSPKTTERPNRISTTQGMAREFQDMVASS